MRILAVLFLWCAVLPVAAEIQFADVSEQAGITRVGESWGNAWGDFDGDGYLDLWATNHKHKPSLYRNNGDGTFTDIIDAVWDAYPYADSHGVAWADFDNDGDQDLILVCGGGGGINAANQTHYNHFYVNENGMLVNRAAELGIDFPRLRGRTPLWLDANNDGRLDLILTGYANGDVASSLFEQTATGFENVNARVGFAFETDISLAQISDISGSGNMGVLMGGGVYPRRVYDTSTLPFADLTETVTIRKPYEVQDVAIADFNGDLYPDLFVARGVYASYLAFNDVQCEGCEDDSAPLDGSDAYKLSVNLQKNVGEKGISFRAEGPIRFEIFSVWATSLEYLKIGAAGHELAAFDGEFIPTDRERNVSSASFVLSPDDPRVVGLAAHPENQRYGIYVGYDPPTQTWRVLYRTYPPISTNWTNLYVIIESIEAPITAADPIDFSGRDFSRPMSKLYVNRAALNAVTFSEVAANVFLDARCVAAGDFDNDMDVDIYLVRSHSAGNLPNYVYENLGNNTFVPLTGGDVAGSTAGKGRSVTLADYDRDGYLDLFVTNGRGAYPFNQGPDQLFRNLGSGNNWLQIDLQGTVSNRDGIGARLFARTPDGRTQLRENGGGIHWSQQDQKRLHFGLADNEKISELTIHWPSGIVQRLTDIPVNQVLRVVEPNEQPKALADVNEDGQIDLLDFVLIVNHFGEAPPTTPRADVNEDGEVNILDLIAVAGIVEAGSVRAAPLLTDLSEIDTASLRGFYERLESVPGSDADKVLLERFLRGVLMRGGPPLETRLHVNYPNPFNPETWIPYQLASDSDVTVRIYDTTGRVVRTLVNGHQGAGYYLGRGEAAYWDGRNTLGESVASGVYIYELVTPTFKQTKRLVIRK